MIRSMTGFARVEQQYQWGQICWELRSVNHRYLDISLRTPEELRSIEIQAQTIIQNHLKRGKFNGTLYFQPNSTQETKFNINFALAQQIIESVETLNKLIGSAEKPKALEILRWPQVLETVPLDLEDISAQVLDLLEAGLLALQQQREREGEQLAGFILLRCDAMAAAVQQVKEALPSILQVQRERLSARLTELVELNSERLEQEMVILAQKMDVAEELDRLSAHLDEIRQILTQNQPVGRRLDFLVQELHREANTLSAKSNHLNTTRSAVELKVLIEQIREQTQNIE